MAVDPEANASALRWGPAIVAGIASEITIILVVFIVMAPTGGDQSILNIVAMAGGFLIVLAWGYWSARKVPGRAVAQGAISGICAVLVYYIERAISATVIWAMAIDTDISDRDFMTSLSTAFLLANALKVAGGTVGGWLVARRA